MILPRPLNLICKLKELSLWQWSYWCYIYKKISMNFLCFVYIECAIFILKVKTILSEIIFTSLSFMVFAFVLMIKHEKCFYCLVEWDLFSFNLLSLGTVLFISHQNGVYLYIIEISCWMKWLLQIYTVKMPVTERIIMCFVSYSHLVNTNVFCLFRTQCHLFLIKLSCI